MGGRGRAVVGILAALCGVMLASRAGANDFHFDQDTFSFVNSTVFAYSDGVAHGSAGAPGPNEVKRYTRRCFVMSRSALQFYKFARFDRHGARISDEELVRRVREVTRMQPWKQARSRNERIVFPGYANLRELSKAHALLLQKNLGLGWPVYGRVGNFRMFFLADENEYQVKMHDTLDAAMAEGGFFVAYLSDYPHFRINHSVLVYKRGHDRKDGDVEHYLTYDPNHPDGPRELKWSNKLKVFNFQKDQEFPGGFTKVYQVYGKWMQ